MPEELKKASDAVEAVVDKVVGAAIAVHQALGPGLLESMYVRALKMEMNARGILWKPNVPVDVFFRGTRLGRGFIDIVAGGLLVLEVKSVAAIAPVHRKQVLHYLRAGKYELGLILNFSEATMIEGIARVIS